MVFSEIYTANENDDSVFLKEKNNYIKWSIRCFLL